MRIRDVHHDAPHAVSLFPDPHVAALLDHVLRVVRHFIRSVRVTKVAGERDVAADGLPLDPAFRICQRVRRSLNPNVRKILRTIKPDVARGIDGIDRSQCLLALRARIISIAFQQCFTRDCLVDRLERRLLVRIRRGRLPQRLWSTRLRMTNPEIDYKLPRTVSLLLPDSYKVAKPGRL